MSRTKGKRRSEKRDGVADFWSLADLFRASSPPDWLPWQIVFNRDRELRGGGRSWDASYYLEMGPAGGRQVGLRVHIVEVDGRRARSAGTRLKVLRFLDAVQKKLWRAGFGGRFVEDDFDGYAGGFNKYLSDVDSVLSDVAALDALKLGQ